MDTKALLQAVQSGKIDIETALAELKGYQDIGHSRVDIARAERNGSAEVIYGAGKTCGQILDIMQVLADRSNDILVTRVDFSIAESILAKYPEAEYSEQARLVTLKKGPGISPPKGSIAIVCAGTSDIPIAEEAALTAEFYGNPVERVYDAGVAGLHRLLGSLDTIQSCRVVVCVAGMEGALPSVVGGLVKAPVIAVPTSVGYGANFGGMSALLTMINSCASGISVVNIDNGFGAGFLANRINRL
jgi:NCAIR mutase (PurE)-related protein